MTSSPPLPLRRFTAPDGAEWEARVVGSARTSAYLAARLHRPVVEFRCVSAPGRARRYAPLPAPPGADLPADALPALWSRARPY